MGAGSLLGLRQHVDAAGCAQRRGSAGSFNSKKPNKVFVLCLCHRRDARGYCCAAFVGMTAGGMW